MPRYERIEYAYECDRCGAEFEEGARVRLAAINEYDGAVQIYGPGWSWICQGERWFCSVQCLLSWIRDRIVEALREKDEEDDPPDPYDDTGRMWA